MYREPLTKKKEYRAIWKLFMAVAVSSALLATASAMAGNLNIPRYSQNDGRWACDQLGTCTTDRMGTPDYSCNNNKAPSGCTTTCLSMIYNFLCPGCAHDPDQLNHCLARDGGYSSGCLLKLPAAGQTPVCAPWNVKYTGSLAWGTSAKKQIDSYLSEGFPVMAKVSCTGVSRHYVVIIGKSGSTYVINDPWNNKQTFTLAKGAFGNAYTVQTVFFYRWK